MPQKPLTQHLIVSLLSLTTILTVPQAVHAASRPTYVKSATSHLTVYQQVPATERQRRHAKRIRVTSTQLFKVQKQAYYHGHVYLKLVSKSFAGWVQKSATVALRHVNANGTLLIYRKQTLNDQITSRPFKLTLTLQGPQDTQTATKYRQLTPKQFARAHLRVTQKVWTDLGQYYQVKGRNGIVGWLPVTNLTLQPITASANATQRSGNHPVTLTRVTKPATINNQQPQATTPKKVAAPVVQYENTSKPAGQNQVNSSVNAKASVAVHTDTASKPEPTKTVSAKQATVSEPKRTVSTTPEATELTHVTTTAQSVPVVSKTTTSTSAAKATPTAVKTNVAPKTVNTTTAKPQPAPVANKTTAPVSASKTAPVAEKASVTVVKKPVTVSAKDTVKPAVKSVTSHPAAQAPVNQKTSAKTAAPSKVTPTKGATVAPLKKPAVPAPKKQPTPKPASKPLAKPLPGKEFTAQQALTKINALINQNHFMGTMLVTNNGPAGVKIFTYGEANVSKKIPSTKDEVYPLASLEKALTGAVVQHLINQGKLTMNTRLSKFYPQIPYANNITIRELLDHTSGIQMGEPTPDKDLNSEAAAIDFTIKHLTSTNHHVWSYSNANFTLLAGIISKVTGKSFMSNLQADVLNPLKMNHTFVYNQIPSSDVTPQPYTYQNEKSEPDDISTQLLSSELGCGNVYASVSDYYNFINSLVTGKLDTKAGFMELADDLKPTYSGGIFYRPNHTIRIGGADNNFRSYYVGTDDGKIAVTLFTNQADWTIGNQLDDQIEQILSQSNPT